MKLHWWKGWIAVASAVLALTSPPVSAGFLRLTVQPIQICNDAGQACADPGRQLFANVADTIWAQAGIDVLFLSWNTFNRTAFLDLSTPPEPPAPWVPNEFDTLRGDPTTYGGSADARVVNMWFANLLDGDLGFYGLSETPGTNVAIGWNAIDDPDPEGFDRIDTIAHELGHSLGLPHRDDSNRNLMARGGLRLVPEDAADVYPNGALDQLDANEIWLARHSPLLVHIPEPGTLLLVALAGVALVRTRRT